MLKTQWRSKDSTKTVLLTYTVQELSKGFGAIRLDIFGIPLGEKFDYRKLGLNLDEFNYEDE